MSFAQVVGVPPELRNLSVACRALDGSWTFSMLVAILTGSARVLTRLGARLGEDAERGALESYGRVRGSEGCRLCGHGSFRHPPDLRVLGAFFPGLGGILRWPLQRGRGRFGHVVARCGCASLGKPQRAYAWRARHLPLRLVPHCWTPSPLG